MITITEALAETKTIEKRLAKKKQWVMASLFRQEGMKDPNEKEGGTPKLLASELQSILDLGIRLIGIRRAIANANASETITIAGWTQSISDWLTYRREILPKEKQFVAEMRQRIDAVRADSLKRGFAVAEGTGTKPTDIVLHLSEAELAKKIEFLEELEGTLDGQLSLKNATIMVEV